MNLSPIQSVICVTPDSSLLDQLYHSQPLVSHYSFSFLFHCHYSQEGSRTAPVLDITTAKPRCTETRRTRNLDGGSQTPQFLLGQQLLPWPTHPSSVSSASLYELQQDRFSKNLLLAVASNLGISAETTVLPINKRMQINQVMHKSIPLI